MAIHCNPVVIYFEVKYFTVALKIGRNAVNVSIMHGVERVADTTVSTDIDTHMEMIIAEFTKIGGKLLAGTGRPNIILPKDHTRDNN